MDSFGLWKNISECKSSFILIAQYRFRQQALSTITRMLYAAHTARGLSRPICPVLIASDFLGPAPNWPNGVRKEAHKALNIVATLHADGNRAEFAALEGDATTKANFVHATIRRSSPFSE